MALITLRAALRSRSRRKKPLTAETEPPLIQNKSITIEAGKELRHALSMSHWALIAVAIFSALCNILMMTGSLYMLEIYDRVLTSRSIPTLLALSLFALILFAMQGIFDFVRSRILGRIGSHFDDVVGPRVFELVTRMPQKMGRSGEGLQPMRDLDAIRLFMSSGGPNAFLDIPWLPFYMALIFIFHWVLGVVAVVGTIFLVLLTVLTELLTGKAMRRVTAHGSARSAVAESGRRNAEVLAAMGMEARLAARYRSLSGSYVDGQTRISDVAGGLGTISRTFRMVLQSAMLGVGAWLVINNQASGGIIIASSILVGRALAPIDLAIAQWKTFVAARQGWKRLSELLAQLPSDENRLTLPKPEQTVKVENLAVMEPASRRLLIRDVQFELRSGSGMAIIGPSGSGKSTLTRALVGAWQPAGGRVRLDGASLDQWSAEQLGLHIGYLPQDVELLSGTVAENISRLEDNTDSEAVIAAARAAGVHDMILNFRDGYQTQIGESGAVLSAGQRQRLALARALYRDPFFVVLDEPNSNLDQEGDKALMTAILGVRKRGGIVIVVSHRPSALEVLDQVLLMTDGKPKAFGPRDEVLARHFPNLVSPAVLAQKGQSGVSASTVPPRLSPAVFAQMGQSSGPTNTEPTLLSPAVLVQKGQSKAPRNTEPTVLIPTIVAQKGQSAALAGTIPTLPSPDVQKEQSSRPTSPKPRPRSKLAKDVA